MKTSFRNLSLLISLCLSLPCTSQAIVINIDSGSDYALNITAVTYTNTTHLTSTTYDNSTTLEFYDNEVKAIGWNSANSKAQFSILNNQAPTVAASDDFNAYGSALSDSFTNTNLLNYSNKDGGSSTNYDYDIIFKYGLQTTDYMIIGERDGNSTFTLQALDNNGYIIGNTVTFNSPYSWNTGFTSPEYQGQEMEINLVDLDAFFDDTNGDLVNPEAIYGFKVTNDDGADIKILAASENSFITAGNVNANFDSPSPIPEPSTYALLLSLAMLGFVGTRRKNRK
ncbi:MULTISPECIES: PEP-CTERM sorting domain-containing protein [unclassified Lentimonas]|uniref:PEP-CTERM sorting domain-containing protein n=1 Tax=unclassified Lentimonas TaxID=2630993 RepID=UPI001389ACF2|nr:MULTISPECIES: PEP-CTERM sorting domain-containing protein [unclassified Lentimonas]